MAIPVHLLLHLLPLILLLLTCVVATSVEKSTNSESIPTSELQNIISHPLPALPKQMGAHNLVEMIMFGLAGIPVYKAVGLLLPFLIGKKSQAKQKNFGRVLNRHRTKRDLAYAQQLLNLLISVEVALEKYGITEPQCQLRATCEIYRKNANGISRNNNNFEKNFIKLVNEMRREIQNPKVVPLAKYVFEWYEEAAIRGETDCNCKEMYDQCSKSLDQFYKKSKGKRPRRPVS